MALSAAAFGDPSFDETTGQLETKPGQTSGTKEDEEEVAHIRSPPSSSVPVHARPPQALTERSSSS